MSYSKHERGDFIKSRLNHYLLMELGHERMTAEEVGEIFDLSLSINTAGISHDTKLLRHPLFKRAERDWVNHTRKKLKKYANIELPIAHCKNCNKQYYESDLKIIDGMAACPNDCGQVFILDHVEPPIVARIAKEGDRERRV